MAVRHEVENLIRRGNIFYWRARVPAVFIHCRPGSRLSLSLHCSDHRKAQLIGRKLNTRLTWQDRGPRSRTREQKRERSRYKVNGELTGTMELRVRSSADWQSALAHHPNVAVQSWTKGEHEKGPTSGPLDIYGKAGIPAVQP